jgi:predicted NBD/HSP70 family sugar kinase
METMGARPQLLKLMNQSVVLDLIRHRGPISRADLARITNLSRPTVSQAVGTLLAADLVREVGAGDSAVGRKPVLLTFNPNAALVVGVDLGIPNMVLGLANLEGELVAQQQLPTPVSSGLDSIVDTLQVAITTLIHSSGVDPTQVCGIGVGVTGAVNAETGVVIDSTGLGAKQWPLRQLIEDRFHLPVFIDNDVNAMLRGEQWLGAVAGRQNALCFRLDTGIGAAMMIAGQIHRGSHYMAGEVGSTVLDRTLLSQNQLSGYGPLEQAISSLGLAEHAASALAAGSASLLRALWEEGGQIPPQAIFEAARQGDDLALSVVTRLSQHLAMLIGNACLLADPEVVVFSGSVATGADLFLPPLLAAMANFVISMPEVVVSKLGTMAGVIGAVEGVLGLGRSSISFHASRSIMMMGTR